MQCLKHNQIYGLGEYCVYCGDPNAQRVSEENKEKLEGLKRVIDKFTVAGSFLSDGLVPCECGKTVKSKYLAQHKAQSTKHKGLNWRHIVKQKANQIIKVSTVSLLP